MTKGEIIESVLKELRSSPSTKRQRSSEDDDDEQDVITYLEKVLRDAQPATDTRICTDYIDLNVECCTPCHDFIFPFDMSPMIRLKNDEYAWVCCAIGRAIKSASGGEIPVKSPAPQQPATSFGYKPFAEFFGGNKVSDDK